MVDFQASNFVKPASALFNACGTQRKWDLIEEHDSIAIVLYHVEKDAALVVRQFRPAVYAAQLRKATKQRLPAPPFLSGFTYELCSGIVDKPKSLPEIAHEEILEECGYKIPPEQLIEVTQFAASVGVAGSKQTLFFAKVTEGQRCNGAGGGVAADGEMIELLALPMDQMDNFLFDTSLPKTSGLMFAFMWLRKELEKSG
eukprot:evm.model.scf_4319.1 EVM.evm.TU.scf_4319.1   scf_4319:1667-4711(-)